MGHPEEHPVRGRRIRQPSKIGAASDLNSSNSPTPPSHNPALPSEPNSMSFKDVLLQFAKMSSRQGQSNAVDSMQLNSSSSNSIQRKHECYQSMRRNQQCCGPSKLGPSAH